MSKGLDLVSELKRYDKILRESNLGFLSTIRKKDGLISTNPVGFVWDGESIRISTLKSRLKYENIVANPLATFCVVSRHNMMSYLEVRGHASLVEDPDRSFLRQSFMKGSGGEEPPPDMDAPGAERVIIVLHPQQLSSPQLYEGRFDRLAQTD